ncbi:hypothetical protein SprV_0100124500 [Sparganum proliferum]
MTSPDAARNKFYEDVHVLLATVPKAEKLIVLAPPHPDQHLPPSDAKDGHLDAPSVATLAPARLCPRPDARSAARSGDNGDFGCRRLDRPSTRHLQDADSPTVSRDWFDDNDVAINKAYVIRPTDNNAAFYCSRRLVQQRLWEMQDAWTACKAEKIQGYAKRNEWKNFFVAIKAVYGPPTKATAPLFSADGSTVLIEKTQTLRRWDKHFRDVFNRPSTISDAAIAGLPQVETNADLDLPHAPQKTIRAVQQLSSGKASGSYATHAEIHKRGDQSRHFPAEHPGKIFARIPLNRLGDRLEQVLLPESQCGFRRHRGTMDMIFAARQLQEK